MRNVLGLGGVVAATILVGSACVVHQTTEPPLSGPSELAQSVSVTVSPDTLSLGTSATSAGQAAVVAVRVRDRNGSPLSDRTVRVDELVGGAPSSCGTLAQHNLQTDANGIAKTTFTAPGLPMPQPECQGFTNPVTIAATVVGSDFQTALPQVATIRLVEPTVISVPGAIAVNFIVSPNPAVVNSQVSFSDAGSSSPGHNLVSFRWDFSDGVTKFGSAVQHDFNSVGAFTATLTVTDDIGQSSFKTASVVITP